MDEGFFNVARSTKACYLLQRQGFFQAETTGTQSAQFSQVGAGPQGAPQIGSQRADVRSRRAMDYHA